jgi:hypothetical protein
MIRSLGKFALTVGTLALLASPAVAQQQKGGRGRGFGGGGAFFLMAPNVQKDLKLSDEQVGKVQEVLRETREKHTSDFEALRDLQGSERQTKVAELTKSISEETKKALSLSDEQSKRFDQISLQARGLQAFSDPSVREKLKLSDEQVSQLRELQTAGFGGRNAGGLTKDSSDEEKAEARKKMVETRREHMAKVQALLSDDQKKAWKELTGEPIEIGFGGGGGRRRPNNN